ncbi:otoferlin isoform X1, partial [Brachionus plicatilis]
PFAKYTMLLDFLLSKKDDLCAQSKIHIDDYLTEPSTNKALKKKISFDLSYETSENCKQQQDLDSDIYSFPNTSCNVINHPLNQSTASDYIRSILKTGEFALNKFNLTENDFSYSNKLGIYVSDLTDESVRSWLQDVNQCPSSLNLALNLIMSYELNNEQKDRFKKSVIRNNLSHSPNETMYSNEIYLPNLLSQIFYTEWTEKIYSWQIRVRIIELKLLHGQEETVYCMVQIGDQKFRTNDKSISNLHYTDDDETFIARIECKQYQKAFNYKISVSVYFKKFLYSDQFVGKFEVDFGTIYRLPGHEAHHKWGELFYINDKVDSADEGIFNSEMVSRGFVKFDVILQSKGDKAKIHYDEYKSDDNDEIENNILVPYGLCGQTQMLRLVINIYSAQILDQKDMSIFDQVKSFFGYKQNQQVSNEVEQVSILLSDEDQNSDLNPFIRVSFAGRTEFLIKPFNIKQNF